MVCGALGLCIGKRGANTLELGNGLVALPLEPREVVAALRLRLGERRPEALKLGGCHVVLVLEPRVVFAALSLRFSQRRPELFELCGGLVSLLLDPDELVLVLGLRLRDSGVELRGGLGLQPPLLGDRCSLRLGKRGFETLDLGPQLLQLKRVDRLGERRLGNRLDPVENLIRCGVGKLLDLDGFDGCVGLDLLGSDVVDRLRLRGGAATGAGSSTSIASSCGSRLGRSGGATAVGASRSFGRLPLGPAATSTSSSFGGTPSAKPYSVLSAPPLCIASACATAAPDANPSSTMI